MHTNFLSRAVSCGGDHRMLLRVFVLAALLALTEAYGTVDPVTGEKKKSKFLAAYPFLMKFGMFWWCIIVFIVMGVFMIDHVLIKRKGPARVDWFVGHRFKGGASRESYWAQLTDPSTWKHSHPVLLSADVRMVKSIKKEHHELAASNEHSDNGKATDVAPENDDLKESCYSNIKAEPLGPMKPGLSLILRHKADGGQATASGAFFCMRECTEMETPADGVWRMAMRTVDVGVTYPFLPDTEIIELSMWPPAEDGSIRCEMDCIAAVNSRVFRWWSGIRKDSEASTAAYLETIEAEVEKAKEQKNKNKNKK